MESPWELDSLPSYTIPRNEIISKSVTDDVKKALNEQELSDYVSQEILMNKAGEGEKGKDEDGDCAKIRKLNDLESESPPYAPSSAAVATASLSSSSSSPSSLSSQISTSSLKSSQPASKPPSVSASKDATKDSQRKRKRAEKANDDSSSSGVNWARKRGSPTALQG